MFFFMFIIIEFCLVHGIKTIKIKVGFNNEWMVPVTIGTKLQVVRKKKKGQCINFNVFKKLFSSHLNH